METNIQQICYEYNICQNLGLHGIVSIKRALHGVYVRKYQENDIQQICYEYNIPRITLLTTKHTTRLKSALSYFLAA